MISFISCQRCKSRFFGGLTEIQLCTKCINRKASASFLNKEKDVVYTSVSTNSISENNNNDYNNKGQSSSCRSSSRESERVHGIACVDDKENCDIRKITHTNRIKSKSSMKISINHNGPQHSMGDLKKYSRIVLFLLELKPNFLL